MKKVLMKKRTSSNANARMVLRRKLESDSGKQIDRSGGGMDLPKITETPLSPLLPIIVTRSIKHNCMSLPITGQTVF